MLAKKLVANWKMTGSLASSLAYFETLGQLLEGAPLDPKREAPNIVFCPPFPYLLYLQGRLLEKGFSLGAQECAAYEKGAHTGEVSASMLKDVGVSYVLIGHSERRTHLKETNDTCHSKIRQAHGAGLTVIYCVGETLAEREAGRLEEILSTQLEKGLPTSATGDNTLIAYEPVWAIGTGQTAERADIATTHTLLKKLLQKRRGGFDAPARVLYGGSVHKENAEEILGLSQVDGALIGGASLDPESMGTIIKTAIAQSGRCANETSRPRQLEAERR